MSWESHWTILRPTMKKKTSLYKKQNKTNKQKPQVLNDHIHQMRHYFDCRCCNRSEIILLPKANTIRCKVSGLPFALSVLDDIIIVINPLSACVRTSAEDDNFHRLSKGGVGDVCA